MNKLTKKQIDIIRECTPAELKGSQKYPTVRSFGYFMPSMANWAYCADYVEYNGVLILVVKRFGEIL